MIRAEGICKSFDRQQVLTDVSFEVNDCSVYGLIGYNGAGKTTLLDIVSGLYKADSGSVFLDCNNKKLQPFDNVEIKQNLFYVTDDTYYFPHATMMTMRDFYCGFFPNWSDKGFKKLTELFGLDTKKRISDFSKGMKRQAAMTIALAARPRYLFLDESFDGLDPNVRTVVCNLLTEFIAETEGSVIAASHNLYELEHICDTVGMLNGKRMICSQDIDSLKNRARKYRVAVTGGLQREAQEQLCARFFRSEGNICTFRTKKSDDEVRSILAQQGELLLFESAGMNLNEIFEYETEGKENEIQGIFTK